MSKLFKKILLMIGLSLLVKGLGFGREILLAYFYGTSIIVDVFITALNIPSVLFALFGTAITTSFIPLYMDIKGAEGDTIKFTNNILNIFLIVSGFITAFGIMFSHIIVKIFASGFSGEAFVLCNHFVKLTMVIIMMTIIQYIYNGYLQANNHFAQQSLMNIPYNILLILTIICSYILNNFYVLAIGTILANISQLIYLRYLISKTPFTHYKFIDLKDPYLKKMAFLVTPVFLSTMINQLNIVIDRTLASRLQEGSIAALNYSNKINSIILEVIILSITTVFYPTLAHLYTSNEREKSSQFISTYLNTAFLAVIPLSLFINFFSDDIITICFKRGAFGNNDVIFTSRALKIISLGLIGFALRDILNKLYYSMQDTVTPVKNGIVSIMFNILLNLILITKYQYLGLAFATSVASNISVILLLVQLYKKKNGIDFKQMTVNILKIIFSSLIVYFLAVFGRNNLVINNIFFRFSFWGIVMTFIYIFLLILFKESTCYSLIKKYHILN